MAGMWLLRLLWLLGLVTGIQQPVAIAPAPATAVPAENAAPATPTHLTEALAYVPANAEVLQFTDWDQIKRYAGAEDITSQSSESARLDLLLTLGREQAAASGFTLPYFRDQAALWGWDSTDLRWEATITGADMPPVAVLRLRDDLDLAALMARFEARDFTRSEQGEAVLYSHPLAFDVDWRTELGMSNAALLPDRQILIHASSPEAVQAVLDTLANPAQSWAALPAMTSAAAGLGEVGTAILAPGLETCAAFAAAAVTEQLPAMDESAEAAALLQELFGTPLPAPYLGLGLGYRYEAGRPVGLLLLEYATAAQAAADLPLRQALATTTTSLAAERPYAEVVFSLDAASVQGSSLLLRVRPVDDRPQRLLDMFYRRDMVFAACP